MLSDSIFENRMQGILFSLVLLAFVAGCSTRVVRDGGKVTVLSEEGTPLEDAKVTVGFKQHLFFPALSGAFDAEVARTDHSGRAKIKELTKRKPFEPFNGNKQPVVEVSFNDAEKFAEWLNDQFHKELPGAYRFGLPDREAWMTYARCGDGRKYPWGDDWPPKYGNYADINAKGKLNSIIGGV